MSQIYRLDRVFFHKLHHLPCCLGKRPKTEDRRLGNPLNEIIVSRGDSTNYDEMCWNAFFDTETVKSTRSSFCIFTRLKLQNEDLRQNALFDAKTLKSVRSSCCSYKMKTLAKTLYLTLKHWIWWGSSSCSFTRLKLKDDDPRWNVLFDAKTLKSMGSSFWSFTRLKLQNEDPF